MTLMTDPQTDNELWRYILVQAGGIRRSRDYWSSHLTNAENRSRYRYLDRVWGEGRPMDSLAQTISEDWPWFGIQDSDGLWAWLEATR